ncbi:tropomodulin-1-like [Saccoglossus kowalevskii]|uniref:Tropomodulin-1-like n=1 Tax=Saccoglossus kowalevskii TaxID=10224 RepID=A0ABM0GJI5_SACKO|nr:PREDICTED: tropomodulin-1-like [Saccoglossus kowalevskii]
MAGIKKYCMWQDLDKYKDIDEDEILAKLTPEELEQLSAEFDPDNVLLPPRDRQKDQTTKDPTGPYDRKHLMDFLEKKAKQEEDVEERVPYESGKKRGKVWQAKEDAKPIINDDGEEEIILSEEWEDALTTATEDELVELAAVLGLHSMLNQVQYQASIVDKKVSDIDEESGKFHGVAKYAVPKLLPQEPPNDTDVEKGVKQVKDNDPELKDLNLNNIKNIAIPTLTDLAEGLKQNTNLVKLSLSNTRLTDAVALKIAEALSENKSLKILNLESNFISGKSIIAIMESVATNTSLLELRIANQRGVLGNKVEMEIAKALEENKTLLKFGLAFERAGPRTRAHDALLRNLEFARKQRSKVEDDEGEK